LEARRRDKARERLSPPENPAATGRALVIGPYRRQGPAARAAAGVIPDVQRAPAARLDEAIGLARAIDLEIVHAGTMALAKVVPATFLGKGKVEEIAGIVKASEAGLVVMDTALSPGQQRNLEKAWNAKVLDRTGLILEIFGRRARTREGTLQVELAHLTYQKSRLVRSWTHLERQRGGFGFLGGPGETQIESDRRMIEERIARIEKELAGVKRTRALHRDSRKRVPYPVVALVGYTNAGKSTLFNRLTKASVLEADMLFATLDPTLRAVKLPGGTTAILSDTVGFISDLPTMLVAAFRATLEEVIEADIVVHVRDAAHPDWEAQGRDVEQVLKQLGIKPDDDTRIVEVWNKSDVLSAAQREELANRAERAPAPCRPVLMSALTGQGMNTLAQAIDARLAARRTVLDIRLDAGDGEGLAWLYRHAEVLSKRELVEGERGAANQPGMQVRVRAEPAKAERIRRRFG
jgi:GTP-binding protein HflX